MLKFALIGCGRIARKHADLLNSQQVDGACLHAVCDVQVERAKQFGEKYRVPWFTDMHQLLAAQPEIDVLCILTPSGEHARNAIELAPYGKQLVVEKPMALTLEDADSMIEACDRAGVRLFVVKQNRWNLPVLKLREALEHGRFGKLVMGTVRVRWCRTQEYYDQDDWRGTWLMDGGVFSNQASHHVDLLEWMLGDPVSVYATSTTRLVDIETEDTGVAVIRFRNGALGVVEATTATRPKDLEGSLSLLGERGTVEISGFAVNEMKIWNFVEPLLEDEEILEKSSQNPPNVYGFGHKAYLEHVVKCINEGSPALVDGLEGRKSLELITAIYESIATGKEVPLRFQAHHSKLGRVRA
jgi:UDP-N-acetyl-2-amino-2-deoxyglucuronate dehydrogenase